MRRIEGFDYRTATKAERTSRDWDEEIAKAIAAGGRVTRIGGDRTVFDSRGAMQFEVHEARRRAAPDCDLQVDAF